MSVASVGNVGFVRHGSQQQLGGGGAAAAAMVNNAERDRSEFAKFCKFFTIRVVQVVVQSRTGRKLNSQSRVICQPSDWFNVNVEELQEVNEELKRALDGQYLAATSSTRTICLLISLRTIDGDTLHLEIWQLSLDTEHCDPGISVRSHLYHRMSVLLRSAIAASRATPAYKLYARRQGAESFVLRYQISTAPVQTQVLGDGAKTIDLGFVASPFGALRVAVHYRTKMVISDSNVQLSGTLRENYFDAVADKSNLPRTSTSPKHRLSVETGDEQDQRRQQQQQLIDAIPWAPLPEPSAYKGLPPLPDISPCFSTFSTSPQSGDFLFSPSPVRRPSGVAFQLGGGCATSCSSSEEGGSGSHGPYASGIMTGQSGSTALVPLRSGGGNLEDTMSKRNSSGTLFKMELSGPGAGQTGATSPKPSSFPDHGCGVSGGSIGFRGGHRASFNTIRRDTFPFAHLLSSCSAPNFGGGFGQPGSFQQQILHHGSLGGGAAGAATKAMAAGSSSTALCKYSPKRRAVTAVMEEQPGLVAESDENLESSREVMVADGVKIVEKRRTRKGKKKDKQHRRNTTSESGEAASTIEEGGGGDRQSSSASESETSSCDDSFVRYEMRPVFATGSDLGAFFNQCKAAPNDLKSFAAVFAQPLSIAAAAAGGPVAAVYSQSTVANAAAAFEMARRSLEEIPERLKAFEEKQKVFDDFVNSLKVDSSSDEESDNRR